MPVRRRWIFLVFLTGWLGGWAVAEVLVSIKLAGMAANILGFVTPLRLEAHSPLDAGAALFLSFWLIAWTAGGVWAIYNWLWLIGGREVVLISPEILSISRAVSGLARQNKYRVSDIRSLRISVRAQNLSDPFASMQNYGGDGSHCLAFDYGARTVRFGCLDEAELKMVLSEIQLHAPSLLKSAN